MESIDEARLEEDLQYRYRYLQSFLEFSDQEAFALREFSATLAPRVDELVDQLYEKLLTYDATARHFLIADSPLSDDPRVTLDELSPSHPQVTFRKDHLRRYLEGLCNRAMEPHAAEYLDMVGRVHTSRAGNQRIQVPMVQMHALLAVLTDLLLNAVATSDISESDKWRTSRAVTKFLWIQNDFISRYYTQSMQPENP